MATNLKKLAGNPGKRPLNDSEPKPPLGMPSMPEHFNEEAKKAWSWLCRMLSEMDILAKSDTAIITLYCDTWSEYVKIRQDVNKYGFILISPKTGLPYLTPHLNAESMFKKQLMQCLSELGLSPSSRSRIKTTPNKDTCDPIADLMEGRYGKN